ncbi:TetR/AcrR family transcriptional regulator [Lachnotalea glycerini]|uniref:TetR/AcrR family transcriptional regulator n=1 Tax=Lachnotalea glycerini TaxID=1763509 RepID=A0A371JJZ3_9FIRM|nr:TetR/AcrR family transcriptional regulator [Lachnotalea glycerini]
MTRVRLEKEERKKQIKEVALQLFIEKGLVRTTMDDIIEKTGIHYMALLIHNSSIFSGEYANISLEKLCKSAGIRISNSLRNLCDT